MAGGLFELRRDAVTGWWVAVVVDRAYDRSRFAMAAAPVPQDSACRNCTEPPGGGVRVRMLRTHAFRVAGLEHGGRDGSGSRDAGRPPGFDGTREQPGIVGHQPGLGLVADLGSWQTIVAPPGHHGWLADEPPELVGEMLGFARTAIVDARAAGGTAYVQVVQNVGMQAGAFTNHLCLDFYDLPQIPHRVGEELGGAARFMIREGVCPYCRLVRDETAAGHRLVYEDETSVVFAPYASRSPFELWIVPRRHQADLGLATDAQLVGAGEAIRQALRLLDALDRPPYNLVLHTAPLHERVNDTYHWHWEIHPRLREIAGLELGTGLPVNPISPEAAVEELREIAGPRRVEWPE
jgi:UDPglucose--hexose-1-phosphate uridylyltransferase